MRKIENENELKIAKVEVVKPFEYSTQVDSLRTELAEIELELDLDRKESPIVLESETEDEEQNIQIADELEDEAEFI